MPGHASFALGVGDEGAEVVVDAGGEVVDEGGVEVE